MTMSGYTGTLFSQSMAGFFHDSKSAALDYKLRRELVSKSRVICTKVPLALAVIKTFTRGVIGSGLHLNNDDTLFEVLSATYSFDTTRQQDLYQLQQQAFETMLMSGECWFIRQKEEEDTFSSWYLVEPDHIFNPPFLTKKNEDDYYRSHLVVDGIEYDSKGIPIAVHYCINPYTSCLNNKKAWQRIPFKDKDGLVNLIHLRLHDRPEYHRGIPILSPLIETLYGLYAYNQAQIQMGILESCQALIVKTNTNKTLNPFNPLSMADLNAPIISDDQNKPKDKPQEFSITPPNNRDITGLLNNANFVVPGQTVHLAPDETLECITPQGPSSNLVDYYNLVLEQCCACLGIPKACLSGIFDNSFSSSKASLAQYNYTISKYRKTFVEQCLKPIYRVYLMESGKNQTDAFKTSIASEWLSIDPPLVVDEVRTFKLYRDAFDLGLVTRDEISQTLFAHRAHEDERLDEFLTKGK